MRNPRSATHRDADRKGGVCATRVFLRQHQMKRGGSASNRVMLNRASAVVINRPMIHFTNEIYGIISICQETLGFFSLPSLVL